MKKEQFSDMMNNIDDELIVNAKETRKTARKVSWKQISVIAACFCLILSAIIVIPLFNSNNGIISNYGGTSAGSMSRTPYPGECLFFSEVEKAREKYAGKDVKYLLAFDIFNDSDTEITDEELKAEYQRLADLGYKLYYIEDHWTYRGGGVKEYIPIVVGLFTEEELIKIMEMNMIVPGKLASIMNKIGKDRMTFDEEEYYCMFVDSEDLYFLSLRLEESLAYKRQSITLQEEKRVL